MPLYHDDFANKLKSERNLSMDSRSKVLSHVFDGLGFLAKMQIHYSDLKPSNILVLNDLREVQTLNSQTIICFFLCIKIRLT